MENEEQKTAAAKNEQQINVVLSGVGSSLYKEIDLVNIFHDMKLKKRLFAWTLILCMLVGIAVPLVMYQINPPLMKVSSIATLDYDVMEVSDIGNEILVYPVTDLTAPDGLPLDLNQITSAYVLQNALDSTPLSSNISVAQLRKNIEIQRNLTEESKKLQEIAAHMITERDGQAYTTVQELKLVYENKVIVSLMNGFGDDEGLAGIVLPDNELKTLLDNILAAYNDYMVLNYADQKLPDNEFPVIDIERMDILESLDLMRNAVSNLYDYCDVQPETLKMRRSPDTGLSLEDIMETLQVIRNINVDYLYSYVYTNSLARDTQTMMTSYEYQLRTAQAKMASVNDTIQTVQEILDSYKNDEIYVSMQDSDTSRSTQTTTDYYNEMILQQAKNFDDLAEVQISIANLENKIKSLRENQTVAVLDDIMDELSVTYERCNMAYRMVVDHMQKIIAGYDYNSYVRHSAAYGKVPGMIASCLTNILLGAVAGFFVAFVIWFLSGLVTEMKVTRGFADDKAKEGNTNA